MSLPVLSNPQLIQQCLCGQNLFDSLNYFQPQEVPKEIPQEPGVALLPVKEITEQATSPEPWGNPDSPLPEENPDYLEDMLDHPAPM